MQKKYLETHAAQQGYTNCVYYTDDSWSGGNFERPAWKRLIEDIEAGRIAHVLVKNMSRIGRDYLQTGFYTEVMFQKYKGSRFMWYENMMHCCVLCVALCFADQRPSQSSVRSSKQRS